MIIVTMAILFVNDFDLSNKHTFTLYVNKNKGDRMVTIRLKIQCIYIPHLCEFMNRKHIFLPRRSRICNFFMFFINVIFYVLHACVYSLK